MDESSSLPYALLQEEQGEATREMQRAVRWEAYNCTGTVPLLTLTRVTRVSVAGIGTSNSTVKYVRLGATCNRHPSLLRVCAE